MDSLLADARYALRGLLKSPGFTLATVLTLALGIGANTAIFSLVDGVLLKPLPYREGDRLVLLRQSAPKADVDNLPFSIREVYDYREQNETLSALVEHHSMQFTLLGRGDPERVSTGVVSAEFFDVLGVAPRLGRTFRPEDDDLGAEAVLVLSHGYWQRAFGSDENVIGRALEMNDRTHTVVGVLPPFPQFPVEHDVYMPTSACPFRAAGERNMAENRSAFRAMTAFGRMAEGVSLGSVQSDFSRLADGFRRDFPETYPEERGYAVGAVPLEEALTAEARTTLFVLLGTSLLVLLIACANVTNLAVARLMQRDRELALRASLGAGRGRLLRQALTESTLLAVVGGLLGLGLAHAGLDVLIGFLARFTPRAQAVTVDARVLAFTLAVSLAAAAAVGLLPLLTARTSLAGALREGNHATAHRRRSQLRALLVAAQVAVTVVLLVGAGLLLRSFYRLHQVDPGFRVDNVLLARLSPNWSRYQSAEDARRFFDALLARLAAIPGVESAAVASVRPLDGQPPFLAAFRIENVPLEANELQPQVAPRIASPDWFHTLGIPLLRGRSFTDSDDAGAPPVGIIDQTLADRHWRDRNPVGERVSLDDGQSFVTIVGVVGDARDRSLEAEADGAIYLPQRQAGWAATLALRTLHDPSTVAREVKEAVHAIDPEQPVDRFETLAESRRTSMASPRLTTLLLGLFAGLALVLSATGLGGVVAYTVSQRTQEIGIRMALGAERAHVIRMVLGQGLVIVAAGLGVGVLGALAASRALASFLFQTSVYDPLTFAAVLAVLSAAALAASFLPARRAASIAPTVALRAE